MDFRALADYFGKLDRSRFIGNEYKRLAGLDQALPIGHGQTISQPSLVLEMTWALDLNAGCTVLEIGTGSGYQTALLARFSGTVYTIERIPELAEAAKERLDALGFNNIIFRTGDGSAGWPEHAPYDRIVATAAAARVPDELAAQLAPGGRMLIPIGTQLAQELTLVTKDEDGKIRTEPLEAVLFVEFKGKYGWSGE
jgi:protein-L-isoaspartate(D-aspartate) O-methyltransferase